MITGLLFTLAQKRPVPPPIPAPISAPIPANDTKAEGRHFPPTVTKPVKAPFNIVRLTQGLSVILMVLGLGLLGLSCANWTFDPVQSPTVQTAFFSLIHNVGVAPCTNS